jgi:hypothetical protein
VSHGEGITVRSFRVVFDLERRIHKVDRWRLPVPYGVPLRGIAYFGLCLAAMVALGSLPIIGDVVGLLSPPLRFLIVPVGAACALAWIRIDGRPGHAAIASWGRFKLSPQRLAAFRPVPAVGHVERIGDVAFAPDERFARYRAAVIEGPSVVLLRYPPHGWVGGRGGATLHVRQLPGPPLFAGKQVRLRAGQRMVVHG